MKKTMLPTIQHQRKNRDTATNKWLQINVSLFVYLLLYRNRNAVQCFSVDMKTTTTTPVRQQQQQQQSTIKIPSTTPSTPAERAAIAKETWKTVGIMDPAPSDYSKEVINYNDDNSRITVYNKELFHEFQSTVHGTYYINGLSSCKIGTKIIHPFEAHGYIKSIQFNSNNNNNNNNNADNNNNNNDEPRITIQSSIVQTPLAEIERLLNIPVAKGVMSTLGNAIWNAITSSERNTANLSATLWPPKRTNQIDPVLIVAGDNGMPYTMDPKTMTTLGPLSDYIPYIQNKKLLAHTRIDEPRQRLILCSSTFQLSDPSSSGSVLIEFMEFDTSFRLVATRTHQTDRFIVFHDWMITNNYYVVPKNPALFNWDVLPKFIMGLTVGTDIFDMDESSVGKFILIPRHNPDQPVQEIDANKFFNIFHFGPCYEHSSSEQHDLDNGKNSNVLMLTIYASVFDKYKFGGEMGYLGCNQIMDPIAWSSSADAPAPRLDKFVFNLTESRIVEHTRIPIIDNTKEQENSPIVDIPVDMPTFNGDGQQCRYSYFLGAARPEGWFPFRSIVKTDLQTQTSYNWDAGDSSIVSEPMFIPRTTSQDEDDGYVISIVQNSIRIINELVIWDSKLFSSGPIAIIDIGPLTPWSVHGTWVPNFIAENEN